jgi:hypothetical protein
VLRPWYRWNCTDSLNLQSRRLGEASERRRDAYLLLGGRLDEVSERRREVVGVKLTVNDEWIMALCERVRVR